MQTRADGKTLAYLTRTFAPEPDYIAAIHAEGERRRPGMQVSAYEGALLAWIVRISGARRILEVGTFMGYSTLWMASALPEDGQITTLEASAEYAAQARAHFSASPHAGRISLAQGDALAWLRTAEAATHPFDLVFIDADKRNYARYLEAALPLLTPRGWVVGDNTLLFGALAGERPDAASAEAKEAMAAFNARLADPDQFDAMLLPTPEGLTVARRR